MKFIIHTLFTDKVSIRILVHMGDSVSVEQSSVSGIMIAGFGKPHLYFRNPSILKVTVWLPIPTFLQVDRGQFLVPDFHSDF